MNSIDYEKIYCENEKLAYKFGTSYNILHDDDMMQNIKMSLFRAVKTYDKSKGIAFSTYAYKIMYNEYMYSFRDKNLKIKYVNNEFYDVDDNVASIFELIPDCRNKDAFDIVCEKEIMEAIYKYLDTLEEKYKNLYIDYYINNINQNVLANKYNISQAQISRKIKNITRKLQIVLEEFK